MAQDYYMDYRTLLLEHTLIRLTGGPKQLRVPSAFGNHHADTVGGGALVLDGVEEVTFDPGYVEWKPQCLPAPSSLKKVCFPETAGRIAENAISGHYSLNLQLYIDRVLPEEVFRDLRRNALPIGKKRYLIPTALLGETALEPVRCLTCNAAPCAAEICRDMRILFVARTPETKGNQWYSGTVFEARPCYDFSGGRQETEEYTAVMEMIRSQDEGWRSPDAEEQADLDIRYGKPPLDTIYDGRIGIALCDSLPGGPGLDGNYHVRFHLLRQHLFFPALSYIRHRGKDWWLYSRKHLTADPQRPYRRVEVGIFNRDGLVTDRQTTEDVYVKYRLLSIL